jgi:hypothetical protein
MASPAKGGLQALVPQEKPLPFAMTKDFHGISPEEQERLWDQVPPSVKNSLNAMRSHVIQIAAYLEEKRNEKEKKEEQEGAASQASTVPAPEPAPALAETPNEETPKRGPEPGEAQEVFGVSNFPWQQAPQSQSQPNQQQQQPQEQQQQQPPQQQQQQQQQQAQSLESSEAASSESSSSPRGSPTDGRWRRGLTTGRCVFSVSSAAVEEVLREVEQELAQPPEAGAGASEEEEEQETPESPSEWQSSDEEKRPCSCQGAIENMIRYCPRHQDCADFRAAWCIEEAQDLDWAWTRAVFCYMKLNERAKAQFGLERLRQREDEGADSSNKRAKKENASTGVVEEYFEDPGR